MRFGLSDIAGVPLLHPSGDATRHLHMHMYVLTWFTMD
jgi:hypothetical protein